MRQSHYRGRHRRGQHRRPAPLARRLAFPGSAAAGAAGLITLAGLYAAGPSSHAVDAHNEAATTSTPLPAFAATPLVQPIDSPPPARHPHPARPALRWLSTPWVPPKLPAPPLNSSQQRAYAGVAGEADERAPGCDLTGRVLAAVSYVDHATHSSRARTALPTALAICAAGDHLDRADSLTLALYRYAGSGAYARAVLAVAREYGAA